jgi:iron only hydrogenase large subunit-like protein
MSERYVQSVVVDGSRCRGRMACMRACPTAAVRVRRGRAQIIEERCVNCGLCIKACPNGAMVPLTNSFTEMSRYEHTVALASPVLYGQFGRDVLPNQIIAALHKIGFTDAFDISDVCGTVTLAVEELVRSDYGPRPLISSLCPVVVRLVQVRFPELVDHISPLLPPREIAAREMKRKKAAELGVDEEEVGAIYLTSCPAKMVAIRQPAEGEESPIDGAIAISDVYGPLLSAITRLESSEYADMPQPGGHGMGWVVPGGVAPGVGESTTLSVSGLADVITVLEDIESRGMRDIEYIAAYACLGGCVGGSLVVENPYVARAKLLHLADTLGAEPRADRETVRKQFRQGYFHLDGRIRPRPLKPLDSNLARAIEKMKRKEGLLRTLPGFDCGVCGAPSCRAFADDVVREEAQLTDCVFVCESRVRELSQLYGIRLAGGDDDREHEEDE